MTDAEADEYLKNHNWSSWSDARWLLQRVYAAGVAKANQHWLSSCQGKVHEGCVYLGHCGQVCTKCGQVV